MTDLLDRLGISHAMSLLIVSYAIRIGLALLLLVAGFWLAARIANIGRRALERARVDITLALFLRNLIYGVLLALLFINVLGTVGVPTTSFIAALGAAGSGHWPRPSTVRSRTSRGACC